MYITIGNTPLIWRVSAVVLTFYCLTVFPIIYIFYKHGRRGRSAWILLSFYVALQLIGNGIIAGAGEAGAPTWIAYVLISVGLSLLLMGCASVLREWFSTTKVAHERKNAKTANALLIAFDFIGLWSLAFMVAGGVIAGTQPFGQSLYQGSAFFLTLLFLALTVGTLGMCWRYSNTSCKPLIWSVILSLPFIGIELFYQLASAFLNNIDLSPIHGKPIYKAVFRALPQAVVVLILIVGAILGRDVNNHARYRLHNKLPLNENKAVEDAE